MAERMTQEEFANLDTFICPLCRRDALEYQRGSKWLCYYCSTIFVVLYQPRPVMGYSIIRDRTDV